MVQMEWGLWFASSTCVCWHLGQKVRSIFFGKALTLDQVTNSVLGAAVQVV